MKKEIYVSKRNAEVKVELVKTTELTAIVKYVSGDKKGESTVFSTSTWKRWWKLVEEIDEEEDCTDENVDTTEKAIELLVGGDSKEIVDKLTTDEKKLVPMQGTENIFDYVMPMLQVDNKLSSNGKCITLYTNNHKRIAYVWKRANCIRIYMPTDKMHNIESLIYNSKVEGKNETSFYVAKENIEAVLNTICKEV